MIASRRAMSDEITPPLSVGVEVAFPIQRIFARNYGEFFEVTEELNDLMTNSYWSYIQLFEYLIMTWTI